MKEQNNINNYSFQCCERCVLLLNYFGHYVCSQHECPFFEKDAYYILESFERFGLIGNSYNDYRTSGRQQRLYESQSARKFAEIICSPRRIVEIKTDRNGNAYFESEL